MKKIYFSFLLVFIAFFQLANAEPIDSTTARQLAQRFYQQKAHISIDQRETPQIVQCAKADITIAGTRNTVSRDCYYVVNFTNGFVIISADDRVEPILAYSTTSTFNTQNTPDNVTYWMDGYRQAIAETISNDRSASEEVSQHWYNLKHNIIENSRNAVGPLVQTTWNQEPYYNNYCPVDAANTYSGHAVTGCVATAMAQIIRYWEYPTTGSGYHSYTTHGDAEQGYGDYGTLSVNYSEAHYDYSLMPPSLSSSSSAAQIDAVAKLMYHCGVSVNMNYGPSGSGAAYAYVPNALMTYFVYPAGIQCIYKEDYTDVAWKNLIKNELDNLRPLIYGGTNSYSSGHAFICDGYDGDYFHINWGWGGSSDGNFLLSPGPGNFNNNQHLIYGISAASSFIRCGSNTLSLSSPVGGVGETQGVEVRGHMLNDNINVTVNGNFRVGNNAGTMGTSTTLPADGGTLYVQYQPVSSTPQTEEGYAVISSGNLHDTILLFGESYLTMCFAPTNLAATVNATNVNLNWTAPIQNTIPESSIISWDSTAYTYFSMGSNMTYCMLQRYKVSDLSSFNQHYLNAISFIPRNGTTHCRIVAYQGGSCSDCTDGYNCTFTPGEQIVNQEVPLSALTFNDWNKIRLLNPFIIDNTKELWFGIIVYSESGYPVCLGSSTYKDHQGGIIANYSGSYDESENFSFYEMSDLTSGGTHPWARNILLKADIEKVTSQVDHYEVYQDSTHIGNTTSTSYTDNHVLTNPCRYTVYAVNDNYCISETSILAYPTIPCLPSVTTGDMTQTSNTTATCSGTVIHNGNSSITGRGFCWSTSHNPTISDEYLAVGSGMGNFSGTLTGLTPDLTYYVRAYVTNSVGTNYGEEQSITLYFVVPQTGTETYTVNNEIVKVYDHAGPNNNYSRDCTGSLTLYTGDPNQTFEITGKYNLANYTSGGNPLDVLSIYDGSSTSGTLLFQGSFTGSISTPITSTQNSITINFTTRFNIPTNYAGFNLTLKKIGEPSSATNPTVTTSEVSNIAATTATCGGNVTADGGASVTAKGMCWSTSPNPTVSGNHSTDGSGTGSFTSNITGLTPNTTYYVRAYATNSVGTSYGEQKTFTTSCDVVAISISASTVISGGTTTINYGQNTTLSASGANSYVWKTGSTTVGNTASVTVNPTSATTYTVTGTNSYGCTGTASVTVAVNYLAPTVTTSNVTGIAATTATCGGNVTADGGASVTARGVCWSTSPNPTMSGNHSTDGSGTGNFTSNITGLTPNTTYYVRAYATNSVGTSYGEQKTFTTSCDVVAIGISASTVISGGTTTINYGQSTTLSASGANSYVWKTGSTTVGNTASVTVNPTSATTYIVTGTNSYGCTGTASVTVAVNYLAPTVTTSNVTGIAATTATCGGNVTADGGASVTARGVCWSTSPNPTMSGNHSTDGSGTGNFTSNITGLTPNTTYYVRAYATNSVGTSYGEQKTFTTSCDVVAIGISASTVISGGTTTINYGQSTTLSASGANSYVWKTGSTTFGNTASVTVNPTSTTTYTVTGTNSYGCTGTASVTVAVNYLAPTVTTSNVTGIAATTATCGGNVTADGGASVTARGVCWSTSPNPTVSSNHSTDGSGTGSFTSNITGLTPNTTYYVRAYATNSVGTSYGEQKTFTTSCDVVAIGISASTAIVGGTTTINYGQSTTLSASGANSYVWKTGSTTVGNTASVTVNPTSATTYTVTGTNSYGCTGTASVTVAVNTTFTLTILYQYSNGANAAPSYTETIDYGTYYSIPSPSITGYTASQTSVSGYMGAENVTIMVNYTLNSYTITYMDGNTVLDIDTFAYGAVVTPIDNPTMTGYTFNGWSEELPTTMPAHDIVVYAQWSGKTFTITYMDGNTVLDVDTFTYGAIVTPIDNPSMTGYTFSGWSEELPTTMPANDIVVYAQWSVNTYTITYMDDNTVLDIDTFVYAAVVTPIDDPTMTGYTFSGWSEELPTTMPANDITVYAQWSVNSYTITYMDGNTVLDIDTFAYDAVVTPIDNPTLTGYTFTGWSEALPSTMPANDITVHAQWSVNFYTITYMDGNTVLDVNTFAYGAVVTPIDNPTMTGYTFNGWSEALPNTMPANDIVVYAQWSVNSYTITYMDGNTVLDIDTLAYGAIVTPIDNPTLTGYTFNGWSEELPTTMPANNITVYAQWSVNSYTITYMDGNTVLDVDTFAYGAIVTPINDPTLTGYTFNGWSETLPSTMPANDITVYAQWSVNLYTITYMDSNTILDVDTFAYGAVVTPIDDPTMTGYTFNGWSETLPSTMPANDITVYAQWSVNLYTITYMDGNTVLDIDTFAYGAVVMPIDNPTMTGYTFNGWSEELPTTMPANDIVVYAQWSGRTFTITYMDGNTVLDIDTFAYSAVVMPIDDPTLTGYTFNGWSEALPATMPANDITVYAQWSVNSYTITYMNGNTVLDIDTFVYGAVVTPIDNPTMTGYTFNGWSEPLPSTMPANDITVYAQWSINTYTITYMDGNTVLDIDTFAYGAVVTPIDDPTLTGYTFNGWSETLPNTMPANNIVVYAQWSGKTFTITYMDGNTVLDVDTFAYGAIVTPIDNPTLTGYTFNGWSEQLPMTMPTNDIVVYAQWSVNSYTITYMDGNTVLDIDTFAYGAVVTPIDNPTMTGYTFNGWSESLPTTMPANDITVYAQWSVNSYTITYMDGNTVLDIDTFAYGAVVTPINNPTMTGYTFDGWSEQLPMTMPTNDIVVYAQWSVNSYTITYMDGNTVLDIDTFAYGAVVTPIDNPTMTGYTFNGWSEQLPTTMPANDITVYAQWSVNLYTITYMDGNTVLDIDTFAYGAVVTPIDNPTMTGYTFNGWSETLPATMPANDIVVYAQWSVNSYTITYMDGNTVLDIDTFAYGAVVTPIDNPTLTGYTFNGWSEALPATMPANDITVYAQWSVNSYTITYMDSNTVLDIDTFAYGAVVTPIDNPTMTGYTFNGWSEELPNTMPAQDITVYAQWSINSYTITYMNGNTVLDIDTFAYGAVVTPINNPTMTGYTFDGWSEELPNTMPANNITVYAQWSVNSYTITYMDGNTVIDIDTFAYGAVVTPIDNPTMTGYTFNGWSEERPTTMPANDITVYAQWSVNSYTITYMDGNTVLDIDTFAYGAVVTPIDNPNMTGYTFNGWSEELPTTMPAHDIVVYAQWSGKTFTITYMDGNTILNVDTFAYGAVVTPIDNPTMTGYTFNGWSESLPTTMPANDITVYAQWSINSYTITYMDGNTVLDIDTFAYGAVVTPIDNPTMTGYTFNGWSEPLPTTMPANNITVYAQWSVNSYTITYMDGNTVLDIDTFAYGAVVTPIDNPTMTGYTFNGWSETLPNTMPAQDITVYAQWSVNSYTITYMNGNTVLDIDTFVYGAVVTPIDNPTMTGYTFNGWSEPLPATMPANDITVYAQWSVNSYTITYMDGNTVLDIDSFAYGTVVTPIDNPTMTGYTFSGWSEELPTTMPANDIVVYAQWSVNSYTITYMDGNTVLDVDSFAYGAVVTPIDDPTMTGYTFNGWSESLPNTMPANDIVVYAQWSVNTYTITYMDGNTMLDVDTFAYGAVVTPIDNPTMTGYTFNGWSEALPATMPANDITVYAQWSVNTYTITYMDGNTVLDIDTFAYGTVVTPIDNPSLTGYTFNGWSEQLPTTMPANDITVYAQWSVNSYTITYMDGNTVLDVDTFAYGAVVTPLDNPTMTGYTFNGWSEALPNTMPANDIVVYAQWSVNTYTITYMDGNTVLDIDSFAYGAVVTPIDNPTLTGYTFNGWSEQLPTTMPANDITVYAQWSVNSYTITYMDGNTVLDIDTFAYGAVVTPIDNPTMTGYTFNGWSEALPATMPANDITVYAQWSINSYTITYMNGNTVLDIDTFVYGAVVTPIDNPTLTGYTFNGWSEQLPNTMPANNITVYAQWVINNYTIIVNVSNDTPWGTVTGYGSFAYGSTDTLTAIPNEHYLFAGWSDFNTDNPRIITVTQDSSFTAYFIPETFDINISSNDETMGTVNVNIDGPVTFNTAIIITAIPAPHYHFVSWSDGNTDNPRTIYVTQALNLTAIFEIDQHVITVLSNDDNMGTVIGGGTYDYGSEILLRAEALEGYEFVSWNDGNTDNPRAITVEQDSSFTAIFHLLDNINDMLLSQVSIYSYNDQIVINNAVGFSAQIFDMTGRLIVNEAVITQSRRQYSISTDGIYLVKVGDSLFKKVIITK